MKVKELIAALAIQDPELEVFIRYDAYGDESIVGKVEIYTLGEEAKGVRLDPID